MVGLAARIAAPHCFLGIVRCSRIAVVVSRAAIGLLVAVLGTFLLIGRARAADPVTLEIHPASVAVCPGRTTRAQVIARNPTDAVLTNARLSWTRDASPSVTSDPTIDGAFELGPHSEAAWLLSLRQDEATLVPGLVHLQLEYTAANTARVAVAQLDVAQQDQEALAELVQLEIHTALQHLDDGGSGVIHLVLRNVSAAPLRVDGVSTRAPSFVELRDDGAWPVTLAAGDSYTVSYALQGADTVRPGKHELLFEAQVEATVHGCLHKGHLVAAHELEAGVYGESAILTALGIPSILLLPGFLMLLTASLLWKLGLRPPKAAPASEFPLAAKDALFWAVAIGLSLGAAATLGTDLREGYGLGTIQWLWGRSVCIGAAGYLLVVAIMAGVVWARTRWLAQRQWSSRAMSPIAILRKLHARGEGPIKPYTDDGKLVVLAADEEGAWVCAPIEVEWKNDTEEKTQIRDRIEEVAEDPSGSCEDLARLLEEGERIGAVTVRHPKTSVRRLQPSALGPNPRPRPIIREWLPQ
ncbi:MAG: hypothetical protein H6712_02980 [Myxococcales bacterium]|nr:hypothetical protein [Myxococcales bacterium]